MVINMDFQQNNIQPQADSDNRNDINNTANSAQSPSQAQQTNENAAQSPYQVQQPYGNTGEYPYAGNSNPYYRNTPQPSNNNNQNNGNSYNSYNGNPYNYGGNNYNNSNNYNNNTGYNNNGYYYNNGYRRPAVNEPGSSLAKASMILGIISIISCFTYTIYPAFIMGSISIVLAIVSKGRRPKLLGNARTGIICATIGLIANIVIITGSMTLLFTNDAVRAQVNEMFEQQYGQSFDEMLEEILENSGYTQ